MGSEDTHRYRVITGQLPFGQAQSPNSSSLNLKTPGRHDFQVPFRDMEPVA